jgi:NAD(P)-dependent dehydrogenase (short-subunit alcohol dehydrogenase family)
MAEQVMEGKFYSITGAGSGIGRATAIRCVQLGAAGLTLCDLNMDGLEETKKLMWVFSTLIPIISIAYFY